MARRKKPTAWKTIVFWVLGAVCALVASFLTKNITLEEWRLFKSLITLMIALLFFLMTGLFWISIAVAVKESE